MANPIKVVKAISRAVGGITGKGAKTVNPVYRNMDKQVTPLSKNVKVVQSEKQRNAALQAEYDKDMASASKQQMDEMRYNMSSGENFGKTIKINSNRRGR